MMDYEEGSECGKGEEDGLSECDGLLFYEDKEDKIICDTCGWSPEEE